MFYQKQIGDYVIERRTETSNWGVRMAGAEQYLSFHRRKEDAEYAVDCYEAADKRRRKLTERRQPV